jgi:hypothetical protein
LPANHDLLAKLSKEHKTEIRGMTKDDLVDGCHDLRIHIRNQFGLLQNKPLLEDTGKKLDPDGAVMVIIETLWRRLQKGR